jgi:hypothetical protein
MELTSQLDLNEIKTAQNKIRNAVTLYRQKFPEEYSATVDLVSKKKKDLLNKYGSVSGDHAIERILFEIPETLHNMFISNLDARQLLWFKTKGGARWFAKTFYQFALTEV